MSAMQARHRRAGATTEVADRREWGSAAARRAIARRSIIRTVAVSWQWVIVPSSRGSWDARIWKAVVVTPAGFAQRAAVTYAVLACLGRRTQSRLRRSDPRSRRSARRSGAGMEPPAPAGRPRRHPRPAEGDAVCAGQGLQSRERRRHRDGLSASHRLAGVRLSGRSLSAVFPSRLGYFPDDPGPLPNPGRCPRGKHQRVERKVIAVNPESVHPSHPEISKD